MSDLAARAHATATLVALASGNTDAATMHAATVDQIRGGHAWAAYVQGRTAFVAEQNDAALTAFVAALADADLTRMVEYRTTQGAPHADPLFELLAHVVNHGTQFRGESAVALTALGHSPGNLDLLGYLRSR